MSDVTKRLTSLTPKQRELLLRKTRKEQAERTKSLSMPIVSQERGSDGNALSFAQERLWFLDQLEPLSTAYTIPAVLRLQGKLSLEALQRSFSVVVQRHESLRTIFTNHQGHPAQVIVPSLSLIVPLIDLRAVHHEQREESAEQIVQQEMLRPFDLSIGPLLRVHLLWLDTQEYILILTMHHIVSDGWSMNVLIRELSQSYLAEIQGEGSPQPLLPIQYVDYALWQRKLLQGETRQRLLDYWKQQLTGAPQLLNLPTDHPRLEAQSSAGMTRGYLLPVPLLQKLQALSLHEGVTLFMTSLASFQVLLMCYSGQSDIVVGTPIANRTRREVEPLVGFFVNTLVLRTDLSGEPDFYQLLARVRQVTLQAYAHQDFPFDQLVEALQPERSLSYTPLFQVLFQVQNQAPSRIDLAGLTWQTVEVARSEAKFDLSVDLLETAQGLSARIEYNASLFDAITIERLLDHWRVVVEGIVADPAQVITQLPLLTRAERHSVLSEWNTTRQDAFLQGNLMHLLTSQSVATPDQVAVVFAEQQLTYRELHTRADRLAAYLQRLGIGPDSLVGVCLERSLGLIVALLAILKAGGAYVPLDPSYPQERLRFMLQDCQASVVLVQRSTCDVLEGNEACIVSLDEEWEALSACYVGEFSTVAVQPEHLAYVIYTSGSTGRPKGVAISHRAISNFLQSMREQPGLEPYDRLLAVTTISFDIAGLEVFLPLCVGAPLVLSSLHESRDGQSLGQLIAEQAITVMQATPTTWQLLVQSGWQGSPHLKALCGGEALPPALAVHLVRRCAVVWNMYGPTETTIWSTCSQVSALSPASNIGRPIANTELYILDQQQSLVPIGVQGELYIGGEGLARGYLQRPDVTAERFVPDPWSQKPGARLYRTGDLVRYHADGSVEHFGRLDRQVKIRGYRIEVGEIEAVLLQEPSVCEAVVQAHAETTGGQHLVAYVVGLPGSPLNLNELRGHVRACLPAYMLPSAFVALEALPLTPNGKVDWHALPLPDEVIPESDEGGVEQPLEELLLGVWRSVLGRKQIGRHENFFEAGGHSLLATQLIGRIRQIFKLEIPLRAVFEAPTIAEFIQRIEQSLRKGEASQLPPLRATARPEKLLLSYAQQRLWFLEQWEPGNPAYLLASAQQINGVIDVQALEKSVGKLLARHESLRTTFVAGEELPLQLIHPVHSLRLPMIDLQGLDYEQQEREVWRLTSLEARTPCDVVTGPLWRITLLRLAPHEHVLLLTIHHLITDGWSMGILVRDLISFYQAQVQGIEPILPVLPIQYSDYALWQRQWLQEEALEQQLTYWKQHLTGAPALLELPTDHPRPQVQTFVGARLVRLLAPELLQQLQQLSQQEGVTLFMTLLAAWQVLLSRYTGQTDLVVGTPVANRTHVETENVIGFFVNTLVLRNDLSGQPDFRELLGRVREVTLQAYAHQDLPFEKLVDVLHIERSLSHSPLFQSAFILQNVPQTELEVAGLSWQAIEVEHTATKFDLTLELRETQQGLSSFIEYNTALFEASTIERLLDHWQVIVEGIVADPSRSIDRLPLLTESEQQTLIYTWNKTQQVSFLHRNLVQLLALQDTTSDRVAVVFAEQQLTYHELHTRANQLAAYLHRLGVGPDTFVGVCLERSLELIVALLAILKAGGAYVPLDPDYPQERLRYMLDDAHIAVLLTQSRLQDRLPRLAEQITLLNFDLDASLWAGEAQDDPITIPQPEQLAYMIYTSGSTGRPKGVMNTHEGVSNRLLWMQQAYQLKADDCVLQKTPFSFDVSVWEFFWPLFCGARLVMARPGGQGDPRYLKALLQEQQISTLHFVPSMLQAFLLEPAVQECYDLCRVICSGEALSAELQARFFATFPASVQLHNLYGPTEAAVDVTSWRCSRESQTPLVPIGAPIANIQVYLLDAALLPVPIGVPGNLYLGGVGLARGYSGRPDLTAESFGPHPFSSELGARLYRTGDLARYRADGVLEFLGRSDYQVKLRGFRIELPEIEACLQAHAAVQEAVVVLREETQERKYLVAYVVPRGEQDADLTEHLRAYLLQHLAAYMVPTFFQLLDALPLTPNGKINRHMLPAPQMITLSHAREVLAPETVIGQVLAQIWQRVLGVEQVGAYDNFFALGGDSILSLQVVARARQAGLALTPKNLFQYQTLAQLAAVTTRIGSTVTIPLVRSGPVPLTPIQHFFFQRALPRWQHFNQALLLQVPVDWDSALLRRVFEIVLPRHDALQLRYVRTEDGWLQSLPPSEQSIAAPFARIDLRMLSQGEQTTAIEELSSSVQSSLDPQHGPIMRIVLFELGAQQAARLLMVAHHLVIDGVSWRVLLEDVQTAIDQLRQGEIVFLSPPTASFQQWAQYLEQFAHSALLQEEQEYWLTAQGVATLPLPLDLEWVGNGTRADERRLSCALTPEETQSLLHEATRAYRCQPQELLLVALLQVLADWIGTHSIRLDLEAHGREDPAEEGLDVSRTVGWFTSLYPVLFTLPERGDEGDWIRAIKEQLRAVPNKGIGYGLLRYLGEDSVVGELLQAAPAAQIIFNYWGQFDQDFTFASTRMDGLRLAAEESGSVDAPENPRSHLLSVSGMVVEKQLQLWFTYSAHAHLDTTITALSAAFLRHLRALLAHCLSPDAGGYTPSDFPLAALSQEVLDRALANRREIEDVYPLTPSQHGMLFHTLYLLQSGVYVEQMLCRLHGELDLMAFERAWQTVIAQHPALRTSFVWQDLDTPVQLVWEHIDLPMTGLDWRDRSPEQQYIDLETFLQHDRKLGFDPAQVPLMRLTLIRYSANVTQVIWSHHHLLLDGWSTSMVLQEVFACYHAYVQGQQHVLEPRRPYRDYLAWLQKQDLRQAEAYWRAALRGIRSPTQLGIDRVGVVGDVEQGYAVAELRLTAETTADWLAFTRQQQLTLNTLMQGAWALVLSRYSDQSDLLFGNVVAGRPPELLGAERMVGVFIHTLPVRIRLHSEDTVRDWLKRLQEQQAEQQQYAYSSLVQVQGWSEIPHDAPLFEVLFVFENYPLESALREQQGSLSIDATQAREQTNYPLTIVVFPGQELRISLRYKRQRFAQPMIQQLLQHMHTVLEQMVAYPERRLVDVTLLTLEERRQLLETWNTTQATYGQKQALHQLFEQQVECTPEAIALVYEEQHLTYQDLNVRANQLAHYLRSCGVGLDQPVGLFMERSLEVLIGLLAILKAGGAYVPFDASYPFKRLAFMMQDAGLAMLLTQSAFLASARELAAHVPEEILLLCLDQPPPALALQATDNPQTGCLPEHLAYVMYTSGSTGQPKGVALSHEALYNLLLWQEHDCPLRPGTVVMQFSPLGFDASCEELFSTWQRGGKIVELSNDEMRRDPEALLSLMAREQVERWFVPYAGLQNVALWATQHAQISALSLRAIMTAGEQLQVTPAIVSWLQHVPGCTLYNYYGPTESHVVTFHTLCGEPAQWPLFPPIGRPIANTQIYLLDQNLHPVPIGVAGELYIGGVSLARGYIHRPDWTAERFVPDMWGQEPGARLYRTGDLARYDSAGVIEFLGRVDMQVKLRGYRVEPGEIEAVLQDHPAVREAIVVLRERDRGEKFLVAYVVSRPGMSSNYDDLHAWLRQQVPDYMVPASLVFLEALPLTPSGKIDRRALPAPDLSLLHDGVMIAPRTPLEELVSMIWADLLHLPLSQLSIHDNFFALGGHSLLATQTISRLRQSTQVDVPLRLLFEAPTIVMLARQIELLRQGGQQPSVPALIPVARSQNLPLSFAQERLWFLQQLEPLSTTYHIPVALRLCGSLVVEALEWSLRALIERHESLRTTVVSHEGEPMQVVAPAWSLDVPVIDVGSLPLPQRDRQIHDLFQQVSQVPFDLARGPLLSLYLLRLEKQDQILVLNMHHIITDGWSSHVLVRDLTAFYQAWVQAIPVSLPALPIQYADYALWQRQWLQGEVLEQQLGYWKQQLDGAPALLELPTDHPRPAVQTFVGARHTRRLALELQQQLQSLSQREGVTLFMTLLATFQVLLLRYSGQTDIIVGTPIANRTRAEVENLIGMFVNTLVLRTNLAGNLSFRDLLMRVREVTLQAYTHQDLPFEQLVEALQIERSLNHTPLFQIFFVLQNTPQAVLDIAGLTWEPVELEQTTTKFDMSLILQESADGLLIDLEYNTALFEASTITRLLDHWHMLLQALVSDPKQRITEVSLLMQDEREQLMVWNQTTTTDALPLSLHGHFERQVARTPEAIALVFEEQHITYALLAAQSDQLAVELQRRGVGPEVLVGVYLLRTPTLVMALLAILKAGGAYVPLDPASPSERLASMLQDASVGIVLTQTSLQARLPHDLPEVLCLDREWLLQPQQTLLAYPQMPNELAYVIYTSGSTGKPKGVMGTHEATVNRLSWMWRSSPFLSAEVACQKTNLSFVDAVWEIFGPLCQGVPLVIIPDDIVLDIPRFIALLERHAVSRIVLVPSLLRAVLAEEQELHIHLRLLSTWISSGEPLSLDLVQRFQQKLPDARLINLYGSSEVAADVTFYALEPHNMYMDVPIGRPIANTQIYVLDTTLQLVPVGLPGELYVGGMNLARGYLDQPALTAERFLADPFSSVSGSRLYRTGDVVRYRPDGNLEYLGREDRQVKIRGYRIELGEIEATLGAHPALLIAVVLVREDRPGDKRLVAYLVTQPGASLTSKELLASLQERLPSYMLPTAFVFLEALPLMPNGKVDRWALPAPEAVLEMDIETTGQLRTPLEELVMVAWSQVLGDRQMGSDDNFFELGGHSLLATQLVARLRGMLRIDVPVRLLFEAPMVASFAQRVEQILRQGDASQMPVLSAVARPEELPLSYAQQRLWFLDQWEPESTAYLIPSVLRMRGEVNVQALAQSVQALTERHESLRTHFELRGEQPVQIIQPAGQVRLPVIDLHGLGTEQREQEVQRLINQEACCPCDLARGPLLRVTLLRLEKLEHVLCLNMHHIITDGWSTQILVRDLTTLYESVVSGHPALLAPLPIQYADYALWQRQWLQGDVLEQHLTYWKRHLDGAPALLELPTDHPRPAVQTFVGARHLRMLSPEVLQQVQHLSQQEGVTLFMTLLAAFQVLLMRYSRQTDIVVGTPIANRTQTEAEQVIGLFVNTLALRSDLSGNPSFRELLARVREVSLQAYTHQDLPFEQVVEALTVERSLSHSPLFQVFFVLQNTPSEALHVAGLSWEAVELEHTTTKFDMSLILQEREQGLQVLCEYNRALFEEATIERLLTHWQILLEVIVQRVDLPIEEIPLLTQGEREQQLIHWNASSTPYQDEALCLHQRIEQQVERTPEAIAVVFEQQQLSYAELNARANQLAHHLRRLGVAPDVLVALCLERSLEMIIGLLAVLKAGGAYVPIDPNHPAERIARLLEECQPCVVLSQQHLPDLHTVTSSPILLLDAPWHAFHDESTSNLSSQVTPENLAYLIYTSGSTGVPKGAGVYQKGFLNLLTWFLSEFDLSAHDQGLVMTSFSFDLTQKNLVAPLLVGGCINIQPAGYDIDLICQSIVQRQITRLNCTPSMFYPLLEIAEASAFEPLKSLRTVFLGGETIALNRLWTWMHAPQFRGEIVNTYGPTECSDVVAYHRFSETALTEDATIPLGRPIANTQLLLLDERMQLVPPLVAGEIYIAGRGVGAGYLYDTALTASKFVPNPFAEISDERLYKTGDLARYQVDGAIEYLGRLDFQIKLRGIRIELGEIEEVLRGHPTVQECVVLAREEEVRDTYLVTYLVGRSGQTLVMSELRTFLQEHLPSYMLPGAWVFLDALPLTANGKLDRRALPIPTETLEEDAIMQAQTPLEELVASAWSAVLGRGQVGRHDNFFELGGHSLLATQLIARLRGILRIDVPVRLLFEAPMVASFAQRVEQILRQGNASQVPALSAVARPEELPLSYAQQRLWFLDQWEPESTAYLIPSVLRMRGEVNVQALAQSVQALTERHESLRTHFELRGEQPVQIIQPAGPGPVRLPVIDLHGLVTEQREQEVQRLINQEACCPCDLARGPLLRVTLLRLEKLEHVLCVSMHHIITDGWSTQLLVRDLTTFYQAQVQEIPVLLPALPIQYADYALWQRQWLQEEVLEQHLTYWKRHLDGAPALLELPTDHPRPAVQTFVGARHLRMLSPEVLQQVQYLSQQEGVTLFMTLLATFQVLLMHYSRQTDIVVGTPIANRTQTEAEQVIGLFVNTLALRSDLSGNPSFRELLARVREVSLQAYTHQDLPFEQVVEALTVERSLSHSPLFQVFFVLQNTPSEALHVAGLSWEAVELEHTTTKFDLSLILQEREQGLQVLCEYNRALFETATIERLLTHWQILLEAIVQRVDLPIEEIPLLTQGEREQQLLHWNPQLPQDQPIICLHQLFEQQVERTPDALAVVYEHAVLSYQELDLRADRLAHLLQRRGVGPDVFVGVAMDRSLELVIALLAVLKAGGAYVPLDPTYPADRLAFMIEDAHMPVVLTLEHVRASLPATSATILCLTTEMTSPDDDPDACVASLVTSENLAYMIYTSGSTGKPKGTMIPHANVVRLFTMTEAWFHFDAQDCWTLFHSYAFDFSVWEMWGALLSGGRLVVVPYLVSRAPAEFYQLLIAEHVTVLNQTPSAFRQLLQVDMDAQVAALVALRLVIFGGEALDPALLSPWIARHGDQHPQLVNMYGTTETTVHVTYRRLYEHGSETTSGGSIGRPIADLHSYVLDRQQQIVPIGVPGELYVGGRGLAYGYWQQAGLTAERFVPHPFAAEVGARLYKTGDLVRSLVDGSLEYLGRVDQQVKLRGYRIELGEIESVLEGHPAVHEAVVLAREEEARDIYLVAYLVGRSGQTLVMSELRTFLQEYLPSYMLPGAWVFLDALPLTANGKLDRQALPMHAERLEEEVATLHAQTPLEELVASAWSAVLGRGQVGRHDNFFDLGGHSLLATQLIARLREMLGIDVPVRLIFEAPTVASLAQRVEQILRQGDASQMPALSAVARPAELPLSYAQQRLWFLDQLEPESTAYLIPSLLRMGGQVNVHALELSLRELVSRHESLRTTFAEQAGQPVQVIHPLVDDYTLPVIDLQGLQPEQRVQQVQRLAQQEALHPCDLVSGPLLRTFLLLQEREELVLLLTLHHIIADGWSMGVLWRELSILYSSYVSGKASPLAPLPIQYADYALWQRQWLQGQVLEAQLAYWKQQLSGIVPLQLPFDRPRSSQKSHQGATYTFTLTQDLAQALVDLSSREQITLFMTLLAVFQTLLQRISGQNDIAVGTDVANRHRVELEGLIGFFVNQLVLRTNLSKNPTFRELLKQVRTISLEAYAHQDLPFEQLVATLRSQRSGLPSSLFQVKFLLDKTFELGFKAQDAFLVPDVTVSQEGMSPAPNRDEDLLLHMSEVPEGLVGTFIYNASLFDEATIALMAQRFVTLVESICADPDSRLDMLKILTEKEKEREAIKQKKSIDNDFSQFKLTRPKPMRLQAE